MSSLAKREEPDGRNDLLEVRRLARISGRSERYVKIHLATFRELEQEVKASLDREGSKANGARTRNSNHRIQRALVRAAAPIPEPPPTPPTPPEPPTPDPPEHEDEPAPLPPPLPDPDPVVEEKVVVAASEREWDLYTRVIAALFFSGGKKKVNLSRSELLITLKNFITPDDDIDQIIADTMRLAKLQWRAMPRGNRGAELQFAVVVRQLYREYGAKERFDDAIAVAMQGDLSGDPIDL